MSFGLTNATDAFTSLMNKMFKLLLDSYVIVFLDDVLVYSKSKKEYADHLRIFLGVLGREKLYAKFFMYDLWSSSVAFLVYIISNEGVIAKPQKIKRVENWARASSITEVRSFCGAWQLLSICKKICFYVAHLMRLTQKDMSLNWTNKCDKNFQKLKILLTIPPILMLLVEDKSFIIYCDVSGISLGVVLLQNKNVINYTLR